MRENELGSAFLDGQEAGRAAGLEDDYSARHDLVFAML